MTNLLIFVFLFSSASFNYYLLNFFLKYVPGDIFTNSIISSVSEAIAHGIAGWIVLKVGPVNGLTFSFFLAAASAAILWYCEASDNLGPVPFSVLAGKFGTGAAFAMLYMSTLHFFPNRFMGRVFGTCNVTARFVTITSSMIAEAPQPTPELIMFVSCLTAGILTRFLRRPRELSKPDLGRVEQAIEMAGAKQP